MHSFDFNIRIINIKVGDLFMSGFQLCLFLCLFFISIIFNIIKLKIITSRWDLEVSKIDFIGSFHTMCDISTKHLQSVSKISMNVFHHIQVIHDCSCYCNTFTVLPAKSYSDVMFYLQIIRA